MSTSPVRAEAHSGRRAWVWGSGRRRCRPWRRRWPIVNAFVDAVNSGDRQAFHALLALDATMSDEGSDRDVADRTEREIGRFGTGQA
ncbi:hypothetical protein [Streptomyces virginiae]